jgi:hypothetical protein
MGVTTTADEAGVLGGGLSTTTIPEEGGVSTTTTEEAREAALALGTSFGATDEAALAQPALSVVDVIAPSAVFAVETLTESGVVVLLCQSRIAARRG